MRSRGDRSTEVLGSARRATPGWAAGNECAVRAWQATGKPAVRGLPVFRRSGEVRRTLLRTAWRVRPIGTRHTAVEGRVRAVGAGSSYARPTGGGHTVGTGAAIRTGVTVGTGAAIGTWTSVRARRTVLAGVVVRAGATREGTARERAAGKRVAARRDGRSREA